MLRGRKWLVLCMVIVCGLLLMGFEDFEDAYDLGTQVATSAQADAGADTQKEVPAHWPEWVAKLTDAERRRMGITEDTKFGVTGPDGQVISGYTWQMHSERAKERAKDGIRLKIGGNQIAFPDQLPVIEDGRVLVPMRPVLESVYVQCRVRWDAEEGKAIILDQGGREVIFVPGQDSYTIITAEGATRSYPLDVPAQIIEGRVMLPLRALLETFRYKIEWWGDELLILAYDTYPSWRKLMSADAWQKALEEDCVPCALVKEAP